MFRPSPRFFITFGLASLLTSALLVAMWVGLIPDRLTAQSLGRGALAEAIAVTVSNSVNQSDVQRVRTTLSFMIERNPDLRSAALRRVNGEPVAVVGNHVDEWTALPGVYSTSSHIRVPILKGQELWGQLELRFKPLTQPGWMGLLQDPRVHLIGFLVTICFCAFYLYLGKVLRELDPSRAIPGRVRAALDTMAEGLLVVDLKGNIVLANQAFGRLVSEAPDTLTGQSVSRLSWLDLSGNALLPAAFPWAAALRAGTPQRHGRVCLRSASGKLQSFIVNASPVLSSGGRHDGVLISFDDVTELQEKEIELRTAKHEAEAANRAKTDFLTNMSHEIRTPMNAILGFTELLRGGYQRQDMEMRRHLDIIHSSGKHLLQLINDILDLAKVESGRLEIDKNICAPHTMILEVVDMLSIRAREKHVSLRFHCAGPVPEVVVTDPGRLRQALTNLVGNAIKFTPQGEVTVTMGLRTNGSKRILAIEVADSGIGIAQDKLDSIFDPFVQAEASTTRRFGGTGLGLTISRRFARAMGGDIVVRSQLGKGSVFTLTFDPGSLQGVRMLTAREVMTTRAAPVSNQGNAWEFPPAHVLVVDDGEANRELLRLVLQRTGIRVSEAVDGQACIRRVNHEHFDAILMDMQMPVMDGYTATRLLRRQGKDVPIFALTAHAMAGFEAEILAAGCTGYLAKPVDIEALLATLARFLGGRRTTRALRQNTEAAPDPGSSTASTARTALISKWANDPELHLAARTFAVEVPKRLSAMERAWGKRDFKALAALAHWLKGSGGTAGFPDFTAPAKLLEEQARHEAPEQIEQLIAQLKELGDRMALFYGSESKPVELILAS